MIPSTGSSPDCAKFFSTSHHTLATEPGLPIKLAERSIKLGEQMLPNPDAQDLSLNNSSFARPRHKWIVGLWLLSAGVTTMAWWVGLGWAAIWFVNRTLS
jgi:hypothetical protein